jgi:hypothetical protein
LLLDLVINMTPVARMPFGAFANITVASGITNQRCVVRAWPYLKSTIEVSAGDYLSLVSFAFLVDDGNSHRIVAKSGDLVCDQG